MSIRPYVYALVLGTLVPLGTAHADTTITSAVYTCDRGAIIPVTYIAIDEQPSFAVAFIEGRQIPMIHRVLTAGPRFIAQDEQESYRWIIDGETARLTFLAADDSATEQTLLTNCTAQADTDPD